MKVIEELSNIKTALLAGLITYDEAKLQAKPFIKIFNDISKEKAIKYGVRAKTISFAGFMR